VPHAKEIFPRAILGTRAMGSSVLVQSVLIRQYCVNTRSGIHVAS
jgi:hypothetical protein